jgi:hypothetical protein
MIRGEMCGCTVSCVSTLSSKAFCSRRRAAAALHHHNSTNEISHNSIASLCSSVCQCLPLPVCACGECVCGGVVIEPLGLSPHLLHDGTQQRPLLTLLLLQLYTSTTTHTTNTSLATFLWPGAILPFQGMDSYNLSRWTLNLPLCVCVYIIRYLGAILVVVP